MNRKKLLMGAFALSGVVNLLFVCLLGYLQQRRTTGAATVAAWSPTPTVLTVGVERIAASPLPKVATAKRARGVKASPTAAPGSSAKPSVAPRTQSGSTKPGQARSANAAAARRFGEPKPVPPGRGVASPTATKSLVSVGAGTYRFSPAPPSATKTNANATPRPATTASNKGGASSPAVASGLANSRDSAGDAPSSGVAGSANGASGQKGTGSTGASGNVSSSANGAGQPTGSGTRSAGGGNVGAGGANALGGQSGAGGANVAGGQQGTGAVGRREPSTRAAPGATGNGANASAPGNGQSTGQAGSGTAGNTPMGSVGAGGANAATGGASGKPSANGKPSGTVEGASGFGQGAKSPQSGTVRGGGADDAEYKYNAPALPAASKEVATRAGMRVRPTPSPAPKTAATPTPTPKPSATRTPPVRATPSPQVSLVPTPKPSPKPTPISTPRPVNPRQIAGSTSKRGTIIVDAAKAAPKKVAKAKPVRRKIKVAKVMKPSPSPKPTPSPTPKATPSALPTPVPTPTPTPKPTPRPTPTPPADLIGDGTGLKADYYLGANFEKFLFSRADPKIEFEWGQSPPDPRIPARNGWSVRWTGQVRPRYSGEYTFFTAADDGTRLWVDGKQLINDWTIHGVSEVSGKIVLQAGKRYNFRMEFFEKNGESYAGCKLYWESAQQKREFIPQSVLYFP